jgi:hypothetical protein
MTLTTDTNEYFSQGSAIDTAEVDEVNRNPGYVPGRSNGLVKCDWILRLDSLECNLTCF